MIFYIILSGLNPIAKKIKTYKSQKFRLRAYSTGIKIVCQIFQETPLLNLKEKSLQSLGYKGVCKMGYVSVLSKKSMSH